MRSAACPEDTTWLLVTNGDNLLDKKFMEEVVQEEEADVVALDYYSRYVACDHQINRITVVSGRYNSQLPHRTLNFEV